MKLHWTSCVEVFYPIFTPLLAAYATVKIKYHDQLRIANVQFYFFMRFSENRYPLAMVSLFSLPDDAVLSASSNTVYLCDALVGHKGLAVVPITDIYSVVAIIPDIIASQDGSITHTGKFSLMRHTYVGLAPFTSGDQFDDNNDNNEDSIEYVDVS